MNRRGFIALLGGAAAGALLLPPERTIFLPPAGGWIQWEEVPWPDTLAVRLARLETIDEMMRRIWNTYKVHPELLLTAPNQYDQAQLVLARAGLEAVR